ncbi:MAG TPA: dTDP-4-dehydrorhamnose reductase [Usitatibacter sp.]|nr:dTDP-4-dehydrorhamnose reductase [Usitatibacter sp.]
MIRALLTGASGQVGSELVRALAGRADVAAYDRRSLDLTDGAALSRAMREVKPALVLNAAAYTAVDKAESEEAAAHAVNAVAPGILGEEARRCGALLVHYSTDYVFDGTKREPYLETDPTAPMGAYGRTKLEGESAIAASGCDHLILRTSWVFGSHGQNFVRTMLRLAETRRELRVVADQHGAPTSSRDLAAATLAILGGDDISESRLARVRGASGVYHATAAGVTTWHAFAQQIFSEWAWRNAGRFVAPKVVPIPTSEYPTAARRPAYSVLSNERLLRVFGVRLPGWRSGLGEALEELAHARVA